MQGDFLPGQTKNDISQEKGQPANKRNQSGQQDFFSDLQKSWAETHKCNENFSKVGHYISPEDFDFNYFLPFTIMISNHANNQYVCTDSE